MRLLQSYLYIAAANALGMLSYRIWRCMVIVLSKLEMGSRISSFTTAIQFQTLQSVKGLLDDQFRDQKPSLYS
jgi:hypothetical protein